MMNSLSCRMSSMSCSLLPVMLLVLNIPIWLMIIQKVSMAYLRLRSFIFWAFSLLRLDAADRGVS